MRRESLNKSAGSSSFSGSSLKRVDKSPVRTRDNSPKMPRPRSEEIPLEDMRLRKTSLTSNMSNSSGASDHHKDITCVAQISTPNSGAEISPRKRGSEETSFTERQIHESRPRRKGQVETVWFLTCLVDLNSLSVRSIVFNHHNLSFYLGFYLFTIMFILFLEIINDARFLTDLFWYSYSYWEKQQSLHVVWYKWVLTIHFP